MQTLPKQDGIRKLHAPDYMCAVSEWVHNIY